MKDIAAWLREEVAGPMHAETCNRLAEAADEIERLRKERAAICRLIVGRDECANLLSMVAHTLLERHG